MPSPELEDWSHSLALRAHGPRKPGRWTLPFLATLLTSVGASGCLDMQGFECTPADTTHSCCVKNNPGRPHACDGLEETAGATFRSTSATKTGVASGVKVALTAVAALALDDLDDFQEAQAEIEEILMECARQAEDEINRRQRASSGGSHGEREVSEAQANHA